MDQKGQTSLLTAKFSESSLQPPEVGEWYHNVTASETQCSCTGRGCQDSDEGCTCGCESCSWSTRSSTIHDSDRSSEAGSTDICGSESSGSITTRRSRSRSASCF